MPEAGRSGQIHRSISRRLIHPGGTRESQLNDTLSVSGAGRRRPVRRVSVNGLAARGVLTRTVPGRCFHAVCPRCYPHRAAGRRLELWYSRQASELTSSGPVTGEPLFDIDVHYLHLGGTVAAGEWDAVRPFVSGGLGVTHFSPGRSGLGSDTRLSMSLGAGGRIPLGPAIGLRLDARWIGTLMDSNSTLFCDDGSCALQVDGDLLSQWELGAGVYFAF